MYRAKVEKVTSKGVFVTVPDLVPGFVFGPIERTGSAPVVGSMVLVVDVSESDTDPDLIVVGSPSAAGTGGLPASSVDNTVPRFDGTGGSLQGSGVTISDTNVVSGLAAPVASSDAATKGYVDGRLPIGSVSAYAGHYEPSGWLMCNGQEVSRTTYAALFAVVGQTYGAGDGSTTFNVPDLRGRTVAGLDNMGGAADSGRLNWLNILGAAAGTQTHTLSAAESGVPAHSHGITDPGHVHNMPEKNSGDTIVSPYMTYSWATTVKNSWYSTYSNTTGITVNNNTAAAASSPHNNMQPTMLLNWIIKT